MPYVISRNFLRFNSCLLNFNCKKNPTQRKCSKDNGNEYIDNDVLLESWKTPNVEK